MFLGAPGKGQVLGEFVETLSCELYNQEALAAVANGTFEVTRDSPPARRIVLGTVSYADARIIVLEPVISQDMQDHGKTRAKLMWDTRWNYDPALDQVGCSLILALEELGGRS